MEAIDARIYRWLSWLAPFAVVALLLGWETQWGQALKRMPQVDGAVQAQPVQVALMPEFKLDPAADARRETVDRTLFNPTRRPAPAAPPAAAAAAAMARGTFTLTGTTVVDGKATAFLREVNGGKVRRVQKGETVNGMLVEDVKADRVRFTQGGDAEEVTMRVAAGPRATIQPVQPGTPPPGAPGGAPPQPGQPVAAQAPQPPVVQDVADVLAQRRRAARAAEAAAAQRDGIGAAAPAPATAPAPAPAAPQSAPAAPQAAAKPDPGWNAVYQRMMQPRRP
jgi:hypothetical protein